MKSILTILLIVFCVSLVAQEIPQLLGNIRHSARNSDGYLHVRWEDISEVAGTTSFYYSTNGGSWNTATVNPFTFGVMESLVPYNYGQSLRYRLHMEASTPEGNMVLMHPAYLNASTFPPALAQMAHIGTDPVGDSLMVYDPKLDITDTYFAATDTKLYSTMANAANNFSTFNSTMSLNVFMSTFTNAAAAIDSVIYAMVYSFTIPGLLSNGLYKVGISEDLFPTFERLGNIEASVVGGKLYMACNIADLVADPQFGEWPSMANTMIGTCLSMRITGSLTTGLDFGFGDYSIPAGLVFDDLRYNVAQNTLPEVICSFNANSRVMDISYLDADQDFPLVATMQLDDDTPYDLLALGIDFADAVSYTTIVPSGDWQQATIRFSDNGIDFVTQVIPIIVSNADEHNIPAPITCTMPNPISGKDQAGIKLSGLESSFVQVDVFNLKGQRVSTLYSGSGSSNGLELSLDSSNMQSGIYFLRISQENRNTTRKFIITK